MNFQKMGAILLASTVLSACTAAVDVPVDSSRYSAREMAKQWRSTAGTADANRVVVPSAPQGVAPKILYLQPLPGGGYVPIYPADNDDETNAQRYPTYQPEEDNPVYPPTNGGGGQPQGQDGQYYYPLYFDE